MIQNAVRELIEGRDLGPGMMRVSMEEIMDGKAGASLTGAFLTLLAAKGETVEEITEAALVMRSRAARISLGVPLLDTCSTGGSKSLRFNISTAAAFVNAGGGVAVAKHGNRAVSGKCGSADVLEELGVKVDLPPESVKECIERIGIGFLFAPVFHRAMKNAAGPRKELGVRTIFNILGPLTNPASAAYHLMGVFSPSLTRSLAMALCNLGVERALVVHGCGLDEITLSGPTAASELLDGVVTEKEFFPGDFGMKTYLPDDIKGGGPEVNAKIILSVFEGEPGACRDTVLANAAAGFVVAGRASDISEGVQMAAESVDSGRAMAKLRELAEISQVIAS